MCAWLSSSKLHACSAAAAASRRLFEGFTGFATHGPGHALEIHCKNGLANVQQLEQLGHVQQASNLHPRLKGAAIMLLRGNTRQSQG